MARGRTSAFRERTRKILTAAEVATAEVKRRGAALDLVTLDRDALVELLAREWAVERGWIDLARAALELAGRTLAEREDHEASQNAVAFILRACSSLPATYALRRRDLAERALDAVAALVDGDVLDAFVVPNGQAASVSRTWTIAQVQAAWALVKRWRATAATDGVHGPTDGAEAAPSRE